MVDLLLLDAVVKETKEALSNYKSLNPNNEIVDINVFAQNLPKRKTKIEQEYYPYVLVCFDEEIIEDIESTIDVSLYFLVGVYDNDTELQGYRDVLNILNVLSQNFFGKQTIGGKYRFKLPIHVKIDQESASPYFLGGMATKWELPKLNMKEDEFV